ncbi:MAG: hypothetical protein MZU95_01580 [Desulfomicrobium escambiense]|nr:hypothetical protein [Desulfomicrobium escambiense]
MKGFASKTDRKEIDLLEYVRVVLKRKWVLVTFAAVLVALAAVALVHPDPALPGHGDAAHRRAGVEPDQHPGRPQRRGLLPQRLPGHLFQHPAPAPDQPVARRTGVQEAQPRGPARVPGGGRREVRPPGRAEVRHRPSAGWPAGARSEAAAGAAALPGTVRRELRLRRPGRAEHRAHPRDAARLRQLRLAARRALRRHRQRPGRGVRQLLRRDPLRGDQADLRVPDRAGRPAPRGPQAQGGGPPEVRAGEEPALPQRQREHRRQQLRRRQHGPDHGPDRALRQGGGLPRAQEPQRRQPARVGQQPDHPGPADDLHPGQVRLRGEGPDLPARIPRDGPAQGPARRHPQHPAGGDPQGRRHRPRPTTGPPSRRRAPSRGSSTSRRATSPG